MLKTNLGKMVLILFVVMLGLPGIYSLMSDGDSLFDSPTPTATATQTPIPTEIITETPTATNIPTFTATPAVNVDRPLINELVTLVPRK